MPGFGRFETGERYDTHGPFSLYEGRPAGAEGSYEVSIKVYEGNQGGFIAPAWERKAAAFLDAANIQKKLVEKGAKHWAPIYAAEKTEDAAYYVTRLYPQTAKKLVTGAWEPHPGVIGLVAAHVASALIELREAGGGRGHGNLHSANVLIDVNSNQQVERAFLTDLLPSTEVGTDASANDLVALGKLIFELVMRREAPESAGFALSQEWTRLGPPGKALHDIADSLMSPQKDAGTLEVVRERLLKLPPGPTGKRGVPKWALAAAGVVVAAGGVVAWQVLGDRRKPPQDLGRCYVLNKNASDIWRSEWIAEQLDESQCKEKGGFYYAPDKQTGLDERYFADPRQQPGWKLPDKQAWESVKANPKLS
ncbi:MAG: hypothetical protein ACOYN0_13360, partial [Phycisphaerales bacterium]